MTPINAPVPLSEFEVFWMVVSVSLVGVAIFVALLFWIFNRDKRNKKERNIAWLVTFVLFVVAEGLLHGSIWLGERDSYVDGVYKERRETAITHDLQNQYEILVTGIYNNHIDATVNDTGDHCQGRYDYINGQWTLDRHDWTCLTHLPLPTSER
jgi:hypothetical protein